MQGAGPWMPAHAGEALAAAHFLDEMFAERPARRVEASPWYEAAGALTARLLHARLRPAPKVYLLAWRIADTQLHECDDLLGFSKSQQRAFPIKQPSLASNTADQILIPPGEEYVLISIPQHPLQAEALIML